MRTGFCWEDLRRMVEPTGTLFFSFSFPFEYFTCLVRGVGLGLFGCFDLRGWHWVGVFIEFLK